MAMESMATLNASAARLMQKYGCNGATDVTGFGILGHAENLAGAQISEVDLVINALPVLTDMADPVNGMPDFKVNQGYSAETSGGILAMLDPQKAADFMSELKEEHGQESWIVGEITSGSRKARIEHDVEIIKVADSFIRN